MSWGFFGSDNFSRTLDILLSTRAPVLFAVGATGRAAVTAANGAIHNFFITGTAGIHGREKGK